HQGRGLCGPCYTYAHRRRQLDQYPPIRDTARPDHDPATGRPGTAAAYVHGCRCADCTAAKTRQHKTWRLNTGRGGAGRVDATGTVRRLRALAAMGWPPQAIGAEIGVTGDQVVLWRKGRHRKILASSAARVTAAYDRLSMTPGPSNWSRSYARNRGWPPPLDWEVVDIDDPSAKPPPAPDDRSSPGRRRARVAQYWELRDLGFTDTQIAERWRLRSDAMDRWLYRNIRGTEQEAAA
ncbi:MAG: hypothetical protein J2P19_18445, partial [Pseudonocardia sp.]|nr:hypothetical protein [Pseudonocardia sp.]